MPKISDREDFFFPGGISRSLGRDCTRRERRQNTKSRRDMASGNNFPARQLRAIGGTRVPPPPGPRAPGAARALWADGMSGPQVCAAA
jgi:hypothetical protein